MTSAGSEFTANMAIVSPLFALLMIPLPLGILLACACCSKKRSESDSEEISLQEVTVDGSHQGETSSKQDFIDSRTGNEHSATADDDAEEMVALETIDKNQQQEEEEEEEEEEEQELEQEQDEIYLEVEEEEEEPSTSQSLLGKTGPCGSRAGGVCDKPCVGRQWWTMRTTTQTVDTVSDKKRSVCTCPTCPHQKRQHPLLAEAEAAMRSYGHKHVIYVTPEGKRGLKCLHLKGGSSESKRRPEMKIKRRKICMEACANQHNNRESSKPQRVRSKSPAKSFSSLSKELGGKKKTKKKKKKMSSPPSSYATEMKSCSCDGTIRTRRKHLHFKSVTLPLMRFRKRKAKRPKPSQPSQETSTQTASATPPKSVSAIFPKEVTPSEDERLRFLIDPSRCIWCHREALVETGYGSMNKQWRPKQGDSGQPKRRFKSLSPVATNRYDYRYHCKPTAKTQDEHGQSAIRPYQRQDDVVRRDIQVGSSKEGNVPRPSDGTRSGGDEYSIKQVLPHRCNVYMVEVEDTRSELNSPLLADVPADFLDVHDLPQWPNKDANLEDVNVCLCDSDDPGLDECPVDPEMLCERHHHLLHEGIQTHQHIHRHTTIYSCKCPQEETQTPQPPPPPPPPPQEVCVTPSKQSDVGLMIVVDNMPSDLDATLHVPENAVISVKEDSNCALNNNSPSLSLALHPVQSALPTPTMWSQSSVSRPSAAPSWQKTNGSEASTPVPMETDSEGAYVQTVVSSIHDSVSNRHVSDKSGHFTDSTLMATLPQSDSASTIDKTFAHFPTGHVLRNLPSSQNPNKDSNSPVLPVDWKNYSLHPTGRHVQTNGKQTEDGNPYQTDQPDRQPRDARRTGFPDDDQASLHSDQGGSLGSTPGGRQLRSINISSYRRLHDRAHPRDSHSDRLGSTRGIRRGDHRDTSDRFNTVESYAFSRQHQPRTTTRDTANPREEVSGGQTHQQSGAYQALTLRDKPQVSAGSNDQCPAQALPQRTSQFDRQRGREGGKRKGRGRGGRGGRNY